jgi:hypothetical protein
MDGCMQLSFFALCFLVMGVGSGWGPVMVASGRHQPVQAVVKWSFVAAFGMNSLGFFLMGLIMLWYPADAHGHLHPPANGLANATGNAAIILILSSVPLHVASLFIQQLGHHRPNERR